MKDNREVDFLIREESVEVLRCRFTKWLEILIYRVKLNYISSLSKRIDTVSLDELIDKGFQAEDPTDALCSIESGGVFCFSDDRITEAMSKLSPRRQEILRLLFIEGHNPDEVAKIMNCSVQHVYNRRSQAVKAIRDALLEEEHKNDG